MTKQQRAEFLNKPCEDNVTWAAQEILQSFTPGQMRQTKSSLKRLHTVLYKEWARELTLNELLEAMNMIVGTKPENATSCDSEASNIMSNNFDPKDGQNQEENQEQAAPEAADEQAQAEGEATGE